MSFEEQIKLKLSAKEFEDYNIQNENTEDNADDHILTPTIINENTQKNKNGSVKDETTESESEEFDGNPQYTLDQQSSKDIEGKISTCRDLVDRQFRFISELYLANKKDAEMADLKNLYKPNRTHKQQVDHIQQMGQKEKERRVKLQQLRRQAENDQKGKLNANKILNLNEKLADHNNKKPRSKIGSGKSSEGLLKLLSAKNKSTQNLELSNNANFPFDDISMNIQITSPQDISFHKQESGSKLSARKLMSETRNCSWISKSNLDLLRPGTESEAEKEDEDDDDEFHNINVKDVKYDQLGNIIAEGVDDINKFILQGTINFEDSAIQFSKEYLDGHSVVYNGFVNGNKMTGQWNIQLDDGTACSGDFHIMTDSFEPIEWHKNCIESIKKLQPNKFQQQISEDIPLVRKISKISSDGRSQVSSVSKNRPKSKEKVEREERMLLAQIMTEKVKWRGWFEESQNQTDFVIDNFFMDGNGNIHGEGNETYNGSFVIDGTITDDFRVSFTKRYRKFVLNYNGTMKSNEISGNWYMLENNIEELEDEGETDHDKDILNLLNENSNGTFFIKSDFDQRFDYRTWLNSQKSTYRSRVEDRNYDSRITSKVGSKIFGGDGASDNRSYSKSATKSITKLQVTQSDFPLGYIPFSNKKSNKHTECSRNHQDSIKLKKCEIREDDLPLDGFIKSNKPEPKGYCKYMRARDKARFLNPNINNPKYADISSKLTMEFTVSSKNKTKVLNDITNQKKNSGSPIKSSNKSLIDGASGNYTKTSMIGSTNLANRNVTKNDQIGTRLHGLAKQNIKKRNQLIDSYNEGKLFFLITKKDISNQVFTGQDMLISTTKVQYQQIVVKGILKQQIMIKPKAVFMRLIQKPDSEKAKE